MNEHQPFPSDPADGRGRRFRRNVVAVGAALGLTLGGLGIAAAQTGQGDGSTTTTAPADGDRSRGPGHRGPGPGLDAAAQALGISVEELRTALEGGQSIAQVAQSKGVDVQTVINAMVADAKEHLAEKVASGDITQAQADEKAANLESRITDLVNRTGGLGRGPGGPDHHRRGPGLDAAAQALGISAEELRTALGDGQSIAQVAQSKGVDVQTVINAMVADAKEHLAEKVASGDITQAQADERADNLESRITDFVNRTGGPVRGPGGPGHRGPGPGLDAAAQALGISAEELRTALGDGQSIAQVAQSKGVDVQTVINAMVADAKEHLAEKVASGDITQAQADERAADLESRITDLVNRTGGPARGPGGRRGDGPGRAAPEGETPS